jgi:hypothetical protein
MANITQWEYEFFDTDNNGEGFLTTGFREGEDILRLANICANILGKEGWELVSVVPVKPQGSDKSKYRYWFKRPLPVASE